MISKWFSLTLSQIILKFDNFVWLFISTQIKIQTISLDDGSPIL